MVAFQISRHTLVLQYGWKVHFKRLQGGCLPVSVASRGAVFSQAGFMHEFFAFFNLSTISETQPAPVGKLMDT